MDVIPNPALARFSIPTRIARIKGRQPYTDPNFQRNQGAQGWSSSETLGMAAKRPRTPRPASSAARIQ
jgi:hypothetical protein